MRSLLSSKEQRQLQLMEILVIKHDWIHLKELSEQLNCTERILKNDLNELRQIFKQFSIQSSTNGIKIDLSNSSSIEDIYRTFFAASQNFQLLEYIFFHEGNTINEITHEFYTSPANLYRIANKIIKKISPNYQLNIQLSPVSITGKESDVRYFFAQYFSERYYFLDWPFPDLTEEIVTEMADYFAKPTNFPMHFATFRMYKFFIAVNIYRLKQNHRSYLDNKALSELYPIYQELPDFSEKMHYFSENLDLPMTPENLEQIFSSFTQTNIFLDPDEFDNVVEQNSYTKKSYDFLNGMIDRLSKQYQLTIQNKNEIIWHIHNTAQLERQETFSESILFNKKENTIRNLETIFPDFLDSVRLELKCYRNILGRIEHPNHLEHLVYTFFTHIDHLSLQLLENQASIKVLIISNFDHKHALTLVDLFQYYCNNRFSFEIWDELEATVEMLNQSPYDIIVSNFLIPGIQKEFICTSSLSIMDLVNRLNDISAAMTTN